MIILANVMLEYVPAAGYLHPLTSSMATINLPVTP
jgi:hypothetical protein